MMSHNADDSKSSDRRDWTDFNYPSDDDRGTDCDGVGRIEAMYPRSAVDIRIQGRYGWERATGAYPAIQFQLSGDQLGVSVELTPAEAQAMIDRLQTAIVEATERACDEDDAALGDD